MSKENIIELNEVREYLEISEDDFVKILAMAKMLQKRSNIKISDEKLHEIIIEALLNIDYDISEGKTYFPYDSMIERNKTTEESFVRSIRNLL